MATRNSNTFRKKHHSILGGLIFFLVFLALIIGCPYLHIHWEAENRIYSAAKVPNGDAIVVFGAKVNSDGSPSPFLIERLDLAKQLFHQNKATKIIVSGNNGARSNHETNAMEKWLIKEGVPKKAIIQDPKGTDTFNTCIRAKDVYHLKKPILVSQSYHISRAITLCTGVGLDAVGVGGDSSRKWASDWTWAQIRELVANTKAEWNLLSYWFNH